jgi:hypothetical protein
MTESQRTSIQKRHERGHDGGEDDPSDQSPPYFVAGRVGLKPAGSRSAGHSSSPWLSRISFSAPAALPQCQLAYMVKVKNQKPE